MNTKRLTTAFLIALSISALCTFVLSRKMSTHAAERPDQHYVAPAVPLEAGEILKPENLKLVNWPAGNPILGTFTKPEELVGRSVLYPIDKDQPITDKFVAAAGSGIGLAGKIPNGMRAVALRSDEVMGVGGFLFPGSHLDVLVTYHAQNSPEPVTFTVLQDAEVLAVGQKFQPDPEGKPVAATVVTLLLTPPDAERAVLASAEGTFHFVLRSGSDKEHVQDVPLTLSKMAGVASSAPVPPMRAPSMPRSAMPPPMPVKVSPAPAYTVETISGDKQSTDSFSGVK